MPRICLGAHGWEMGKDGHICNMIWEDARWCEVVPRFIM